MFEDLANFPSMQRWRQQKQPIPVVVAIVRKELELPHFLLIQRNGATYHGQWALVGGKWDFGETLSQAIVREVREETNLETDFVALRGLVSERVMTPPAAEETTAEAAHFLLFVCELAVVSGWAQEQQEGAVAWFTWDEIEQLQTERLVIPSDFAMLQQFVGVETAVPHIEAEMMASIGQQQTQAPQLLRFQQI
ncbi:MAG: NUDIX hydrolase [Chloroflexota bacterium]|nr:NUDIX hydrolase [Anaerolineales bacterium]MCB8968069.1 NUDIX hydrolase [Ardenticatenaceae bacterium]